MQNGPKSLKTKKPSLSQVPVSSAIVHLGIQKLQQVRIKTTLDDLDVDIAHLQIKTLICLVLCSANLCIVKDYNFKLYYVLCLQG